MNRSERKGGLKMGYDKTAWLKRMRLRSDMSAYVTHLTRENLPLGPIDVLLKILKEQKLNASTNSGFISGSAGAVCFQDAPLHSITQNLIHEQFNMEELGNKVRYRPFGLCFRKDYAFRKGARPVIYEQREIAKQKFKDELWRVVTFDLTDADRIIDWTHEREWRTKGDFAFELSEATILITNSSAYNTFMEKVDKDILEKIGGIVVLDPILT